MTALIDLTHGTYERIVMQEHTFAFYDWATQVATAEERHARGIYDLDLDYPDYDQCAFPEPDWEN